MTPYTVVWQVLFHPTTNTHTEATERSHHYIRQVHPGDYQRKLKPDTIAPLKPCRGDSSRRSALRRREPVEADLNLCELIESIRRMVDQHWHPGKSYTTMRAPTNEFF